jgi:hypothetical protein
MRKYIINNKEVDLNSIEFDGIDMNDYPDFSDAYISAAVFQDGDGTKLTVDELEMLQEDLHWELNEMIINYLN